MAAESSASVGWGARGKGAASRFAKAYWRQVGHSRPVLEASVSTFRTKRCGASAAGIAICAAGAEGLSEWPFIVWLPPEDPIRSIEAGRHFWPRCLLGVRL